MRYKTGDAFRTALEERLRQNAKTKGQAWLMRQRKMMVFDRLLARLLAVSSDRWIVKGAVALNFRLGELARATKDLDLARRDNEEAAMVDLLAGQSVDLGDFFVFTVEFTGKLGDGVEHTTLRYKVTSELDGRRFEQVTLDIGFSDSGDLQLDQLQGPALFEFADIPPVLAPTIPLQQHIAEKVHAYARIYGDGRVSSRTKDLVDLVLIASNASIEAERLRTAILSTFATRASQEAPTMLLLPPNDWIAPYRKLAIDTGIDPDINAGYKLAAEFLDPVLNGVARDGAVWDPEDHVWRSPLNAATERSL